MVHSNHRGARFAAAVSIVAGLSILGITPGASAALVRSQPLVVLDGPHDARAAPSSHARSLVLVPGRTPITAIRTVLPVVERQGAWIEVRLPGRPNGRVGWIDAHRTTRSDTTWHVVIRLSTQRVMVYHGGHLARSFAGTVGAPSTPTPTGQFFVEESVALPPSDLGAPYALALSARSTVYRTFDGGPGQIALHGLINDDSSSGSHGCVRLPSPAISWLVHHIGAGTPITITT